MSLTLRGKEPVRVKEESGKPDLSLTLRGKEPVRVKEDSGKLDLNLTLRKDMSSWVKGKGRKQRMSREVKRAGNRE